MNPELNVGRGIPVWADCTCDTGEICGKVVVAGLVGGDGGGAGRGVCWICCL